MRSSISSLNRGLALFLLAWLAVAGLACASEPAGALRVAVLPLENLSGVKAPLKEMRYSLIRRLRAQGKVVVDEASLEGCLSRHRIRYTGAVDTKMAQQFRDELKADAVLVTTVDTYSVTGYPKIGISSRLVSTDEVPHIIWMDHAALCGDDHPGILGLGLVSDPHLLQERTLRQLMKSLAAAGSGAKGRRPGPDKTFGPRIFFRGEQEASDVTKRVAILPFINKSKKKNANQFAANQFVKGFVGVPGVEVIEPGVVRERMLVLRTVMKDGVTYRDMDRIAGEMRIDVFVSGKIFDYVDTQVTGAEPAFDFSTMVLQHRDRKIIWSSSSYNKGGDPVWLFDFNKVNGASSLAAKMIDAVVSGIVGGS
jgi:hypothetical protein